MKRLPNCQRRQGTLAAVVPIKGARIVEKSIEHWKPGQRENVTSDKHGKHRLGLVS